MFGPRDDNQKFIPFIIHTLLHNPSKLALTAGQQRRDFVYVADVADLFVHIVKHVDTLNTFEEFSAGTGQSVSIREIVEYIHDSIKSTTSLEFGALPYRINEIMDSAAQIELNHKIDWKPSVDIYTGLDQTISYYKNQQY
jgi:nucleoside-diphosphate-sugar epimerase